jgi:hypothetical protein
MTTLHMDRMTVHREGDQLMVFIPMTLKTRGGRKEIILPDGLAPPDSPAHKSLTQESLVIAIARAYRWKALLESRQFSSITQLAQAVKLEKSYVGRLLNLTLLAPDIIQAIMEGREPSGLSLEKLTKHVPLEWGEQRAVLGFA